jgi:hypothetical protein
MVDGGALIFRLVVTTLVVAGIAYVAATLIQRARTNRDHKKTTVTVALYRMARWTPSQDDVNRWMATRLPEERIELLIQARIPAAEARSRSVRRLSNQDLEVMAALHRPVQHDIDDLNRILDLL